MSFLKANREPKDYKGWYVNLSQYSLFNLILYIFIIFWKMYEHDESCLMHTGLLPTQSGKSFIFFAKTRMVCFTKKQFELFTTDVCLIEWKRNTWPKKRKSNFYCSFEPGRFLLGNLERKNVIKKINRVT